MSQCIVPNWSVRQDQHDEAEEEEGKSSSHVNKRFRNPPVPMSGHGVAELIWENGHFNMQGLGGLAPSFPTKTTWPLADDTLESLVHQAAHCKRNPNHTHDVHSNIQQQPNNIDSVVASSAGGKWPPKPISTKVPTGSGTSHKRPRPDPAPPRKQSSCSYTLNGHTTNNSVGTASFRDTDTTMMTWASFESPGSFKTKTTDDDSACHNVTDNLDEEVDKKTETVRSHSTTRSRAAAVHNQSERKRRDRINQKMKTLQKLVPNASKTDKASMLDEVIEYTKQLQAQLDMMSSRTMPHMLMPMGMQHLHMPLLARMGLAMGMGMRMLDSITPPSPANPPILHPTNASQIPPQAFVPAVPPPFMQLPDHLLPPHLSPPANPDQHRQPRQIPLSDPYSAYLAQAMNMDLYNKMAAFYQQQAGHMAKNMPANSKHPESSVK